MHRSVLILALTLLVPAEAVSARSVTTQRLDVQAPAAAQGATTLPVMTRQRAVHGPSRMGGLTSTRDGRWLFQAEGTTLVFLETSKRFGPHAEGSMQRLDGSKRVPFGAEAFTVSRMMLDPAADDVPGPNTAGDVRNLFLIAAGRSGLWAMEADVDPAVTNRVWRIDDSMDSDPATQDGVRWCCDVDTTTIQGVEYVVALFGSKSDSRLRLYRLSDVRNIADPSNANSERGHELAPYREVVLGDRPQAPPAPPQPTYARSVAVSMDIDTVDDQPGQERANVFVALGSHGLALVTFSGAGVSPTLRWGPIFGTGSSYADGTGHPADKSDELYGNLMIEDAAKYTDPDPVMRRDFPVFCDVAVFRGTTADQDDVYHLYVAVDHLFWLVFDLGAEFFDPDMPILHHEGTEIGYTQPFGTTAVRAVAPSPDDDLAACARELKIAHHPVHGPYLVVTSAGINFVKDFVTPTEGYVFDAHLEWAGGRGRITSRLQTQWYPIRASYPSGTNYVDTAQVGGNFLHVPAEQDGRDTLKFFHVGLIGAWNEGPRSRNGVGLSEVRALAAGPPTRSLERSISHSGGRQSFALGTSLLDPDLIFTGGNDGAVPKDGFLALGTNDIKRHYEPTGIPRSDERGVGGFFIDTGSQWQDPGQDLDHQYLFCTGANRGYMEGTPPFWTLIRWQLMELQVPQRDAYTNSPVRKRWWYMTPPRDNFGNLGFLWYMNAYVNPEFDAFLDANNRSERLAFATHVRTAEGLTVIDRDELMAHALTQGNGRELHLDSGSVATSRSLVTHPEFNDMPRDDATLQSFWQHTIPGNQDDTSVALQWMPTLVEVQAPGTTDFGRWVLAVPCGQIYSNPDWDIYTDPTYGNDEWLPDPGTIWDQKYSHGLVQFWEVGPEASMGGDYWPLTSDDPGLDDLPGTSDDVAGNSPLRKIISPDPDANIWKVVPLRMTVGSVERVFLVCVDFAGHVYVYSIEDILDVVPTSPDDPAQAELDASFRIAEWTAPLSQNDDLQTNVFDVGIDHRGGDTALFYVAVRRVGVVLLEFDPASATPLVEIDRIQTPDFASKVQVRQDNDTLIVNDYGGGIRVYEE